MSSEWQEITFGDFVTLQRGHDLPDQSRKPGRVPILGSFGVTGFHDKAKAFGPGVTVGRSGASFGVAAYTEEDYWPLNTALYVTDFKGNDPKFVYYFMRCFDFSHLNSGSAQPSLNRNHIYPVPIRVPIPELQREIACFLTTIDTRITLLRETNTTLESIAQALFKSWFVDFDPVRAKQEGREPEGMDADTASLFPDSFEESELGLVPKGWRVLPLNSVCTRITDGSHFSPKSEATGFPMASVKDMDKWGFNLENCRKISEDHYLELVKNDCRPLINDVVIAKDGSYLKHIFVVDSDLELVILSSIAILRPSHVTVPDYLAFMLGGEQTLARMENYVSGAVIQRIVLKDFRKFPILVAPRLLQDKWEEAVAPIMKRIRHNIRIVSSLTGIRDALLPRLISGQLRLPDAEGLVEEAAA